MKKYGAGKEVLLKKEVNIPFSNMVFKLDIKIAELVAGQTFKCKNIADILEYEKNVKEACETFKTYLEVTNNFGGEEMIEFRTAYDEGNAKPTEHTVFSASEITDETDEGTMSEDILPLKLNVLAVGIDLNLMTREGVNAGSHAPIAATN